jgi:periplasmic copper chaperone A
MSVVRHAARTCALVLAFAPAIAAAHMVVDPPEGPAGGYFKTAFRVTHGCQGTPTVSLTIRIPEGVVGAKPQAKPGWMIEIKTRPLDPPVDLGHGFLLRQTATEITWKGGSLANAHFDDFALTMRTPDKPGATLYFPTIQTCERGSYEWIEVPPADAKPGDHHHLHAPAPAVKLRAR